MREIPATRTYLEHTTPTVAEASFPDPAFHVERIEPCPPELYRFLYREVGQPWHWLDRRPWTDAEISAHVSKPGIQIFGLYRGDIPTGFFELSRDESGSVEVAYFGLIPAFIGRKLGAPFLSAAIAHAWAFAASRVWLHTCTLDHPAALPNYLARGFRVVREEQYVARIED
jgi:GNAT superfamily N-acetyltransferase